MRVVGGSARGANLLVVPGDGTRPILDRVKTALFDILRPRISGTVVLDLFAGSGSVGIEALSQGAAHCTFIERGHKAVATIKRNLELTGLADRAEVLHADAFQFLKATTKTFDLIYIAPPQYKRLWVDALQRIGGRLTLPRDGDAESDEEQEPGLAIVQIDPKEYENVDLGPIREVRQKRYGNTLLVFYENSPGDAFHTQGDALDPQGDALDAPRPQ
jgi:16S rRNA (guanine966-N2)-methyltransferase